MPFLCECVVEQKREELSVALAEKGQILEKGGNFECLKR